MTKQLKLHAIYRPIHFPPHSTTLLNTKVQNFTMSQKNCGKFILLELCQISINLITFGIDR